MALAANSLTDYATVAADLGLSGSADQSLIERMIGAVSEALEQFCRRKLTFQPGLAEVVALQGGPKQLIDRTPIASIASVVSAYGSPLIADINIDDPDAGFVWSDTGWPWSANVRWGRYDPNFTFDQQPGTEDKIVTLGYAGGFITGPQAYGASAWPGASSTLDVGTLCVPSGQPAQLWMATATAPGNALVTGGAEPTWPASPRAPKWGARGDLVYCAVYGGTAQVDGAVTWIYLGTPGSAGARGALPQGLQLPASLEEACIVGVRAKYRERKDDPNIKSESLLGASASYDRTAALPAQALELAREFRRAA